MSTGHTVNSYPPQPNAGVLIKVSITTRLRANAERWRMTTTNTEPFALTTTLATYDTDLPAFLTPIWNYVVSERTNANVTDVIAHFAVQIENTTAPTPSAGSWVQKKMHYDGRLTSEEYSSSEVLQAKLEQVTEWLKSNAKY